MTTTPGPAPIVRPTVDAGRLWAGGAATALVAALVALVGVLDLRRRPWISAWSHPPLLPFGESFAVRYAVTAGAAFALVATGLAHLLALTTPRPRAFFSWIVALATLVGVVLPFATHRAGGRQARHRGRWTWSSACAYPQPAVVGAGEDDADSPTDAAGMDPERRVLSLTALTPLPRRTRSYS